MNGIVHICKINESGVYINDGENEGNGGNGKIGKKRKLSK